MCGIFGVVMYDDRKTGAVLDRKYLLERLAYHSESRGTHAGGIAFRKGNGEIGGYKNAGAISKNGSLDTLSKEMKNSKSFMGHTRFTTVGTADKNENNHPFKSDFNNYAMAHNGTVSNVLDLEITFNLPPVNVDTDSFVFSRMIDNTTDGRITHENLKEVAEEIRGTFNFTIIDENESIWLVKNNNPLVVVDFKELGMIAYASTRDIMANAIIDTYSLDNLDAILDATFEKPSGTIIEPKAGEILEIKTDGTITTSNFKPARTFYGGYGGYGGYVGRDYNSTGVNESYGEQGDGCGVKTGPSQTKRDYTKSKFNNETKTWEINGIPEHRVAEYLAITNGVEFEVVEPEKITEYKQSESHGGKASVVTVLEESIFSIFLTKHLTNRTYDDGRKDEIEFMSLFRVKPDDLTRDWSFREIFDDLMESYELTPKLADITLTEYNKFFSETVSSFYDYYSQEYIDGFIDSNTDYTSNKKLRNIVTSTLYMWYLSSFLVDEKELDSMGNLDEYLREKLKYVAEILTMSITTMMFDDVDAIIHLVGLLKYVVQETKQNRRGV